MRQKLTRQMSIFSVTMRHDIGKELAALPVPFTGDWNEFVNMPMTPTEMAKARKLIIRQKSDRKAGLRDSTSI